MKNNVTNRKPDSVTKTNKASVQTYVNSDKSITVTTSKCGSERKGGFVSKKTIGK